MKLFLLSTLLIFNITLSAQSSTSSSHLANHPEYQKQIGVNTTDLLSNLLNFSNSGNSFDSPTYYFTWRKLGETTNRRIGLGGSLQTVFDNGNHATDLFFNFRIGKERFHNFAKRLQVFYGWDFKSIMAVRVNGSSEQIQLALGGAPILGMQIFINDRLSLSTEVAYNLLGTIGIRSGSFNGGVLTNFEAPNAVFLNYKW